jgi:hypothetical protein
MRLCTLPYAPHARPKLATPTSLIPSHSMPPHHHRPCRCTCTSTGVSPKHDNGNGSDPCSVRAASSHAPGGVAERHAGPPQMWASEVHAAGMAPELERPSAGASGPAGAVGACGSRLRGGGAPAAYGTPSSICPTSSAAAVAHATAARANGSPAPVSTSCGRTHQAALALATSAALGLATTAAAAPLLGQRAGLCGPTHPHHAQGADERATLVGSSTGSSAGSRRPRQRQRPTALDVESFHLGSGDGLGSPYSIRAAAASAPAHLVSVAHPWSPMGQQPSARGSGEVGAGRAGAPMPIPPEPSPLPFPLCPRLHACS